MTAEFSSKLDIINILSDGVFHSGEDLESALGITQREVDICMVELDKWGLKIECINGRGYRLLSRHELLDINNLHRTLPNAIIYEPVIKSTNTRLMQSAKGLDQGTLCLTEHQPEGRGRRGKTWVAAFSANICMSMLWHLPKGVESAMGLSVVVGETITRALDDAGYHGLKLKWPNDIYHEGKKLCGILIDLVGGSRESGSAAAVIGIGLNVNMSDQIDHIDQPWTQLHKITGSPNLDRTRIVRLLVLALNESLARFESEGVAPFIESWNHYDHFANQSVRLIEGKREIQGICLGIDEIGALKLETNDGIEHFIGGELSLRAQ